jgi:hypothetical protein
MATLTETAASVTINPLERGLAVIRANWSAYVALNGLFYGLIVVCMGYVAWINPALQTALLKTGGSTFTTGPLAALGGAYTSGLLLKAIGLTFVVNLLLGSLVEMSLPTLVIPFAGLLMGIVRASLWGLMLAPTTARLAGPMIPHALTLLIEGQAYVLVMLAAYIHGKAFLRPSAYGLRGHGRGYVAGLKWTGWLYVWVALLLAVAAAYEAFEVIYLAPLLR